ncbi:hypothetical protein V6N12_068747 [Hibiscus sabdariffa]|uniref:RRM domain-containing protein n=1 Tax=Hibiscus sabdariffa TaxID=183260 RepID=A0ABR2FQV3_9ROSI
MIMENDYGSGKACSSSFPLPYKIQDVLCFVLLLSYVVKVFLENIHAMREECEVYRASVFHCKNFLEGVLRIIGESLSLGILNDAENFLNSEFDCLKAIDNFSSPSGNLDKYCASFFVERIVTAKVIERFVKKLSNTSVDSLSLDWMRKIKKRATLMRVRIEPQSPKEEDKDYPLNRTQYERVIDVYISYRNCKTLNKPTTFAFVRFRNGEKARVAKVKGNNRIMGGYRIKVFMVVQECRVQSLEKNLATGTKKTSYPLKDERSYKEALLGGDKPVEVVACDDEHNKGRIKVALDVNETLIRLEKSWPPCPGSSEGDHI